MTGLAEASVRLVFPWAARQGSTQRPRGGTPPCPSTSPGTRDTHRQGTQCLAMQPALQCLQHLRAPLCVLAGVPWHCHAIAIDWDHAVAIDWDIYYSKVQLLLGRRKRPSLEALPKSCFPVRLCTILNAILRSIQSHQSTVFQYVSP